MNLSRLQSSTPAAWHLIFGRDFRDLTRIGPSSPWVDVLDPSYKVHIARRGGATSIVVKTNHFVIGKSTITGPLF
jgi:hypothetical protein